MRDKHAKLCKELEEHSGTGRIYEKEITKEEDVLEWMRHWRNDLNAASSSLWTYYSMLNIIVKAKYMT